MGSTFPGRAVPTHFSYSLKSLPEFFPLSKVRPGGQHRILLSWMRSQLYFGTININVWLLIMLLFSFKDRVSWFISGATSAQHPEVAFLLARLKSAKWLKDGVHSIWGICLGTFIISGPTLSCSHWSEFVHTECHHDVIMALCHSNGPACCDFSRRRVHSDCDWESFVKMARALKGRHLFYLLSSWWMHLWPSWILLLVFTILRNHLQITPPVESKRDTMSEKRQTVGRLDRLTDWRPLD